MKHILLSATLVASMFAATTANAQEDVNPLLKYINKDNGLEASVGGRMFADVAYYHSEWTPMKSGAALTDARLHGAFKYGKLYPLPPTLAQSGDAAKTALSRRIFRIHIVTY